MGRITRRRFIRGPQHPGSGGSRSDPTKGSPSGAPDRAASRGTTTGHRGVPASRGRKERVQVRREAGPLLLRHEPRPVPGGDPGSCQILPGVPRRVRPRTSWPGIPRAYASTSPPRCCLVPHSSRERQRNVKKRRERPSNRMRSSRPHSRIVAGPGSDYWNTLKVETRVQIPLGLRRKPAGHEANSGLRSTKLEGDCRGQIPPDPARGWRATSLSKSTSKGGLSRTLSRWRHGFEPRWDYKETLRSEPLSCAGEPSRSVLVPHLSRSGPPHVTDAVGAVHPDAIIHQATALAGLSDFKHFDRTFALTNRLRTEGIDSLLAAAQAGGVRRLVAQSFTSWPYAREGGPIKTEEDPLDPEPVAAMRETLTAIRYLERVVVAAGGLALRYGAFYGTSDDAQLTLIRKRRFPIVGDGAGSGRSFTSRTRPRRPSSRSSGVAPASTTSSTTSLRQFASGSPPSPK